MDPKEIVDLSATEIARRVRARELDPVDVVHAHLQRIEERAGELNAFVGVLGESALREAEALRDRANLDSLALAGVPVAIKDNVDVESVPTRHGSRATSDAPAARDDELVTRLRRAGAIVIGKTTMPELAIWPLTEPESGGPTRNPIDPSRTPGGSSGGSAAAVASGMAALALGSDGGGSIRVPAASCGLVGVKPAPGLVPLPGGEDSHWFGCSAVGPLARTVADARVMLAVLAGEEVGAEAEADADAANEPSGRLRITVSSRHPVAGARVNRAYKAGLEDASAALRSAGHTVSDGRPPYAPTPQSFFRCWLGGIAEDAAPLDQTALEPRTQRMARHGARILRHGLAKPASSYAAGAKLRSWLAERDVFMTLILAHDPPAVGKWANKGWFVTALGIAQWMGYTAPWNVAGAAAVALTVGRSPAGMPIAVQLLGPAGSEQRLMSVAAELERASVS